MTKFYFVWHVKRSILSLLFNVGKNNTLPPDLGNSYVPEVLEQVESRKIRYCLHIWSGVHRRESR